MTHKTVKNARIEAIEKAEQIVRNGTYPDPSERWYQRLNKKQPTHWTYPDPRVVNTREHLTVLAQGCQSRAAVCLGDSGVFRMIIRTFAIWGVVASAVVGALSAVTKDTSMLARAITVLAIIGAWELIMLGWKNRADARNRWWTELATAYTEQLDVLPTPQSRRPRWRFRIQFNLEIGKRSATRRGASR